MKYLLTLSLLTLLTLIVLLPIGAMATVVPNQDADWWNATTVYVAGDTVEYEPAEEFYLALSEVGLTNVGFEPDINPQLWQPIGRETETPEPNALLLVGSGLLGIGIVRRRIAQ